jgi:hypothetical protein
MVTQKSFISPHPHFIYLQAFQIKVIVLNKDSSITYLAAYSVI